MLSVIVKDENWTAWNRPHGDVFQLACTALVVRSLKYSTRRRRRRALWRTACTSSNRNLGGRCRVAASWLARRLTCIVRELGPNSQLASVTSSATRHLRLYKARGGAALQCTLELDDATALYANKSLLPEYALAQGGGEHGGETPRSALLCTRLVVVQRQSPPADERSVEILKSG